jgi:hypothetical protein
MTGGWEHRGEEFPLTGHPGVPDGLVAWAQPDRPDGTFSRDNRGDRKPPRRVHARADPPALPPPRPDGLLDDTDWRWAVGGDRRWASIEDRLGERAEFVAADLARAGCVQLVHDYRRGAIVHPPRRWLRHPSLADVQKERQATRRFQRDELADRAAFLTASLAAEWPGAAAALAGPVPEQRLVWLVRAAGDLLDGRSHDGARAFVQAHAGHTKAREDLPRLLADAGFEPEAIAALGVNRNPYIGLAGPVRARLAGRVLDFSGWPGPVDLRLPADSPVDLDVLPQTATLLIIENRQAAEAISDWRPQVALIWCHGQPPARVLDLISRAAAQVEHVVICPDADLGGIRIAARIQDRLAAQVPRTIVDIGMVEHIEGEKFGEQSRRQITNLAGRADGVGNLAQGCLRRGYAIEQEAPARAALRDFL